MSELIPWDEFNPNMIYYFDDSKWEDTRVACPECGAQLLRRTDIVLTTYPPQRQYRCPMCNWWGSK